MTCCAHKSPPLCNITSYLISYINHILILSSHYLQAVSSTTEISYKNSICIPYPITPLVSRTAVQLCGHYVSLSPTGQSQDCRFRSIANTSLQALPQPSVAVITLTYGRRLMTHGVRYSGQLNQDATMLQYSIM
jgi:hypothetical protein